MRNRGDLFHSSSKLLFFSVYVNCCIRVSRSFRVLDYVDYFVEKGQLCEVNEAEKLGLYIEKVELFCGLLYTPVADSW